MNRVIFLLLLIASFPSCQEEPFYNDCVLPEAPICDTAQFLSRIPSDTCIAFPPPEHTLPFYETFSSSFFVIGENNFNELVYVESFFEDPEPSPEQNIWKIDTCSNERSMIFARSGGKVELSKKNWILFRRMEAYGLWKIKTNGDSLTQVTDKTIHDFFDW